VGLGHPVQGSAGLQNVAVVDSKIYDICEGKVSDHPSLRAMARSQCN